MSLDSMGPNKAGRSGVPGGRMTHSLSTPSGVDGTPPTITHHRGGKKLAIRVQMLDDSVTMFQVQAKALGKVLFEQVCRQLNLLEADYFGLEYQEPGSHTKYWLDLEKPLNRQVGLSLIDPVLRFCVKFYTPDPAQLEEEYTRFLFCLQVKRDLATGILQCNDNTAALMASYIVQASCGDYVVEDYPDHTYLSSYRFVPHQDGSMQRKIMENHKKHFGQSPAEADLNLLETARRCELYGMKMHQAKDIEGVPLNLSVAHMGIAVFQGITRINTFSWAKIRKISFKRKRFLVKLHPEGYGYYKDTVEFFFEGRNECKNFWKKCVENHGFFRCSMVQSLPRRKARVLSRGSSFRYSGKTQKQVIEFVRDNYVKRQTFQRSQSFRQGTLNSGNRSQSHTSCNVNSSISAHPLLPIETAEWDFRNQSSALTTPSQMRKGVDSLARRQDSPIDHTRSQVTAAQVETYQMKTFAAESPQVQDHLDSSRSVSPGGTWTSPHHHYNNNIHAADRARAHQDGHSSGLSHHYALASPKCQRRSSKYISEEASSSMGEEMVSSISQESVVLSDTRTQRSTVPAYAIPAHYSNTYSMSKSCSTATDDTDNVIYTDINDLYGRRFGGQAPNKGSAISQFKGGVAATTASVNRADDLYATVNRKTKTINRINAAEAAAADAAAAEKRRKSDEFLGDTSRGYANVSRLTNGQVDFYANRYTNDSGEYYTHEGRKKTPVDGEKGAIETVQNYDFSARHSLGNIGTNYDLYLAPKSADSDFEGSILGKKNSSERLEYELSSANLYSTLQYKTFDGGDTGKDSWLKSASCKELYDCNFEESGEAKRKALDFSYINAFDREFLSSDRIDSPITRYDDANRSLYVNKNHSVDVNGEFPILESKVYSSSYPGSTYNTVDHANRRGQYYQHQFDFGSHDDVSHDSYELLEKSDDELYARIKNDHSEPHSRSCSLDSGNYIPTDDESVSESAFLKYRNGEIKSRSVADIMDDLFLNEDPRDLPREKLCVKSDGSFYNKIKHQIGSRTSSQESRSDYYESKISKSSDSSKKSKDSVYHTDSKKSRETLKSKHSDRSDYNSRASSQESKESFGDGLLKNYEMPTTTGKKIKNLGKKLANQYERNSSQESKSDYYDAKMSLPSLERSSVDGSEDVDSDRGGYSKIKVKSHDSLLSEMKSGNYYNSQSNYSTFPSNKTHKTSHVHSISLQNVEIERNTRSYSYRSNENTPICHAENQATQTQNLWSKAVEDESDDLDKEGSSFDREFRRKSDSDNIFSFDKDKIESLTQSSMDSTTAPEVNKRSPEYPLTPELMSEFDKLKIDSPHVINVKSTRKEELMAKTHFEEYNPKMILDSVSHGTGSSNPLTYIHPTVERTKSDPNSLANRSRLGSNSRRHVLMHQKSIDLTPADSSDEEYFYKQIPSAPPLCQSHRSHFEIPKSYDVPVAASDIPKSGFEMPSSFFKEYEKRHGKVVKEDIPYVLHKRHVMNGTAPSPGDGKFLKHQKPKSPKSPKSPRSPKSPKTMDGKDVVKDRKQDLLSADILPDLLDSIEIEGGKGFLFTQNIDLSKVDPVTLEVDKTSPIIQMSSPKRDITRKLDPKMLEALNSKLSQIESDSGSTESFAREAKALKAGEVKLPESFYQMEPPVVTKKDISIAKRLLKPRIAPKAGKQHVKGKNKAKIRITSFSSDDESLDSDDVFGSTEATPTKLEFSPPQSRKEIEPILKLEQDRIINAWGRGQTMSSTEIEGSPPQQRRLADLESRYHTHASIDPSYQNASELRRISERSISIPSSEEEGTVTKRTETTQVYHMTETIPSPILESCEFLRTDDEVYETCKEDRDNEDDLAYTLITKKDFSKADSKARAKLIEEFIDSSIVMRSKGHAPILFAHARLNLSEGSAFASLQRQKATQESPDSGRRAKSLDTPVISLHRLPPMNAFSSKDDTVGFEEEAEILEEKPLSREITVRDDDDVAESVQSCVESLPSAKSRPKTSQGNFDILKKILIDEEEREMLDRLRYIERIALQGVKIKEKRKSKLKLRSGDHLILDIPKYRFDPFSSGNSSRKTSPGVSRASSVESTGRAKKKPDSLALKSTGTPRKSATKSRSVEATKTRISGVLTNQKSLPDIKKSGSREKLLAPRDDGVKRAKSQESVKRNNSKEKPRRLSKDKSRSQEENEIDIAKRKERQQKLYESAMKQTINLLSPVKDSLPAFPAPEDKISVKTEGDKIIIETEIRSKAEDHVFIAKSPKKLDTSLVKFSRSFDDTTKTTEKLDKANRSFEDRNKSMEEASDKSDIGEDFVLKSPRKIMRSQELKRQIEGSVVHKKFEGKSKSLEKKSEQIHQYLDIETKTRSLDKNFELHTPSPEVEVPRKKIVQVDVHRGAKAESSDSDRQRKSTDSSESKSTSTTTKSWTSLDESRISSGRQDKSGERRSLSQTDELPEELDMQAIISERRNLDLLKRQSLPSEDAKDNDDKSPGPLSKVNSEEESLTSVSEIKAPNLPHRVPTIECEEPSIEEDLDEEKTLRAEKESTLLKLSLERSRSDETASWKTIECEEYVGSVATDASDISKASTLKGDPSLQMQNTLEDARDSNFLEPEDFDMNIIVTPPDSSPLVERMPLPGTPRDDKKSDVSKRRSDILRINVERSRSSDTGSSWTSGEKDTSPVRGEGRDKGSMDEESSVSCSISRPMGISQDNFDLTDQQRCKELRDAMLKKEAEQQQETIRTPTRERKASTPTLEKQSPIDLESGSELDQDPIEMKIDQILARDDSVESTSEAGNSRIRIIKTSADNVHKKLCRMSGEGSRSPDRSSGADVKKLVATRLSSSNGKSSLESKSSMESKGSISVESKGSFETESSSGSLGIAQRRGELGQKEQQSTWKPFPIESSGSSSIEENWAPPDQESYEKYDVSIQRGVDDLSSFKPALEKKESSPDEMKESDSSAQDDLSDFTTNFGYPAMTTGLGLSINPTDILGYGTSFALGRTLSRISERSTNSEKSSMEDDLSKASADESVVSTDHQTSFSSDPPSNTNLAYISDADRRTSAEMPDIPCDSATVDRLSDIYAAGGGGSSSSSGRQTGRFAATNVEDERVKAGQRPTLLDFSNAGSQDSEDWPLPEIPYDHVPVGKVPVTDNRPLPKTFGWRHSMSMQSQDSENWPSPPDSGDLETPIVESVETFYLSEPQSATQVMVDSFTDHTPDDHDDSENRTLNEEDQLSKDLQKSPTISVVLPYEETAYMTAEDYSSEPVTCLSSTFGTASCLRSTIETCSSRNTFTSSKDIHPSDKVIISQPTRTPQNQSPNSLDDDFGLADDVFGPGTVKIEISPDDTRLSDILTDKISRGSNNSDTSLDDILSGSTYLEETVRRNLEPRLSSGSCKKCSHSSHSEEETSSLGTDLDGTVKMGLQQKKCTHSSHSEDTSIGLSISEWSTGTNTVRQYANLSGSDSLSAVSNHSTGARSEKSNHTKSSVSSINKSTESLNEKSASLSGSKSKFSCDNASAEGAKYEVFSNSEISSGTTKSDDTTLTLTEMAQSITEWSTSSSKTLVGGVEYPDYATEYKMDKKTLSIEYMPLKPPKVVKKQSPPTDEKDVGRLKSSPPEEKPQKVGYPPPRIVDMEAKPHFRKAVADSSVASKRKALELMSQRYQSQDIASESENLPRVLAPVEEQPESGGGLKALLSREPSPFDKPLIKHHSYDDKTLSKSQIREYKSSKVRQSQSFHEHMIESAEFPKIEEEKLSSSTTTHNSETTSTDNSSPMPSRPGKLVQCSPYYSSSLSSESPPIQVLQKPPRKSSGPRVMPKSPPSGNDTDSSLDFRQQDPKFRTRGYRKRKQVPAKRTRLDRVPLEQQESSECSEGYFQEVDSGSSDMSKREYCEHEYVRYFEEEPDVGVPEEDEEEYVRYESYPGTSFSTRFESLDMTEGNVDEMGFPKYDRLGHITKPMYRPQEHPATSSTPPIKPQRQRKRQLRREDSNAGIPEPSTSRRRPEYALEGVSPEVPFPEDIYYSSEDSFAAGFSTQIHVQRKVELPYPDFLSDHEDIVDYPRVQPPTSQSGESEKSYDGSEFDMRTVPPPMFLGDSEDLNTYHGINGNVSLDRRGEVPQFTNRYDLSLGSDKSSSLSHSERDTGSYDIKQAEIRVKIEEENANYVNANNNSRHTNGGSGSNSATLESQDGGEARRKRWPTDKAYFLAKELLMTERTYKRDLDVLNTWFREELSPDDVEAMQPLFQLLEAMIQHHGVFLRDLEHRLVLWEGRGTHETHRIGDVMLKNMVVLPLYEEYLEAHRDVLHHLVDAFDHDERFQQVYREFEQQKVCYVPVGYLLLKPFHRLLHYQLLLDRLLDHYGDDHFDRTDCHGALMMLGRTTDTVNSLLPDSENYVLLCELQRDLLGFDQLVQPGRKLIRQGCLLKHSKRGLQQRMFFLFSDVLLYASKSQVNQTFKILGHVPLRSLLTENAEHNAFVIFGGQRAITVSAGTTAEKTLWLAELAKASTDAKMRPHVQLAMGSLKNCSSSEEGLETCGLNAGGAAAPGKTPPSRSNTSLHVCWHRGATVGLQDHLVAANNQLSGFLLRKFKNSSGWQKLWVVFTSFCLYFYKSYQDEFALASLPLLGYTVGPPGVQDALQKDFVFKLSFKNHVYFFRAESEHTYNRWLEVLRSTTQTQDFKNLSNN